MTQVKDTKHINQVPEILKSAFGENSKDRWTWPGLSACTERHGRMAGCFLKDYKQCQLQGWHKLTAVASSSSGAERWDSPLLLQSYTRERCSWEPPSRANPLWRCCSSQSSTQYCSHRSRSRGSRALPGLGACRHAEAGENESTEGSTLC